MNDAFETSAPWYRHPWVWGIIAIPGSSVIVGIVMITLAASGPTDLVRDDYYKAGLTINQEFGARERAAELGIEVKVLDRGAAGCGRVRLCRSGEAAVDGGGATAREGQSRTPRVQAGEGRRAADG